MRIYECPTCEAENFSGPHTLRVTSSKDFAEIHMEATGHTVTSYPTKPIEEES